MKDSTIIGSFFLSTFDKRIDHLILANKWNTKSRQNTEHMHWFINIPLKWIRSVALNKRHMHTSSKTDTYVGTWKSIIVQGCMMGIDYIYLLCVKQKYSCDAECPIHFDAMWCVVNWTHLHECISLNFIRNAIIVRSRIHTFIPIYLLTLIGKYNIRYSKVTLFLPETYLFPCPLCIQRWQPGFSIMYRRLNADWYPISLLTFAAIERCNVWTVWHHLAHYVYIAQIWNDDVLGRLVAKSHYNCNRNWVRKSMRIIRFQWFHYWALNCKVTSITKRFSMAV